MEALRASAEARAAQRADALTSEESLKSLVVAQLQQVHQAELEKFKQRDFELNNTLAQRNSEVVVARAEIQILKERLRVAKEEATLLLEVGMVIVVAADDDKKCC